MADRGRSALGRRLTYANVMSTIAVFAALATGGAWAADKIGAGDIKKNAVRAKHIKKQQLRAKHIRKGQVRTRQLAKAAVATGKLRDGAVTAQKIAPGVLGGPAPPSGPAGGNLAGTYPNPRLGSLEPGQTLTGVFGLGGGPPTGANNLLAAIEFTPRLPAPITPPNVNRIGPGGSTADCPGPGQAAPGVFCLYETSTGQVTFNTISDQTADANGVSRDGAVISYIGTGSAAFARGTWAVTAP